MTAGRSERATLILSVAVAMTITILDGFDAMSLSLVAPMLSRELGIAPASLGLLFSCQMVGMMGGAALGGYTADRLGRLRSLLGFIVLFSLAAFTMPLLHSFASVAANRFVAGVGLGAATPIIVALVAATSPGGRSAFAISTIWAGLPAGGIFAALFNYFISPSLGWQSIFVAGGILPLLVAIPTYLVFRASIANDVGRDRASARLGAVIREVGGARLATLGALFLCGYSAMSIVVYWLPTILTMRGGSPLLIMSAFIGVNLGSALGSSLLGFGADRFGMRLTLPLAWCLAGLCLLGLEFPLAGAFGYIALATLGATFTAGSIALLIVLASRLQPDYASTMIGSMVTLGRLGQVGALAVSGAVAGMSDDGSGVFYLAGAAALLTALLALLAGQRRLAPHTGEAAPG